MDVAPRPSREAQVRIARQRRYDDEQLSARYYSGVQGPLEKSASELEQRLVYQGMRWSRVMGTVLEKYVNLPTARPKAHPAGERIDA
jgi:hypothetical protein